MKRWFAVAVLSTACAPPTPQLSPPDAGVVDDDDDDDQDPQEPSTPTYTTAPPPGGDCGRDWRTFDPDNVYVIAMNEDVNRFGDLCVVFGLAEPRAFAGSFLCYQQIFEGGSVARATGTFRYRSMFSEELVAFAPQQPLTSTPPCAYEERAPDDVITLLEYGPRLLFDENDLPLDGSDEIGWFVNDGSRVLSGFPVAFNATGDVLTTSSAVTPTTWYVVDPTGVASETSLPLNISPEGVAHSVRRDGTAFRLVGREPLTSVARGWRVEADGTTTAFATYDVSTCSPRNAVLLPDDSVIALCAGGIMRLLPDGSPAEVMLRAADVPQYRFIDLVTGS